MSKTLNEFSILLAAVKSMKELYFKIHNRKRPDADREKIVYNEWEVLSSRLTGLVKNEKQKKIVFLVCPNNSDAERKLSEMKFEM